MDADFNFVIAWDQLPQGQNALEWRYIKDSTISAGLDAAFMRLYYDCVDERARQVLASTLFWFLRLSAMASGVMPIAASRWCENST